MTQNLLFIKHKSFTARTVDNDLLILKDDYKVKCCNVNSSKGFTFFFAFVTQFFYLLFNIYRSRIIYIWFADYHSLIPIFFAKLFGKRSLINIGGYDAHEILVGIPDSFKSGFRKFCVRYSIKNATKLIPVSNMINEYLLKKVDGSKCEVIYNCVDLKTFYQNDAAQKENLIITVGGGGEYVYEAERKRLDFFIELGNIFNLRFPEYNAKFFLIGHDVGSNTYNFLKPLIKSQNIKLKPITISIPELVEYYRSASIYMQLSYIEAFGIAQIEAMLNGCIPVSNAGGAIPEIVGDAGFVIKDYDLEKYLSTIKDILDNKYDDLRQKAIKRVLENFTLDIRKTKLLKLLHSL
jgi:glycosyltransferase involved in cell wall biosynthesis